MSLDSSERAATAADLRRNLAASGLTAEEVGAWLGLSPERLAGTSAVDGSDPALVWYVRDALDQAVRETGGRPQWTVLTDGARGKARRWFSLRDVPARP